MCDREGRDEDCNTGTFGNKDEDRDGYVDAGCFNWSGGRSGKRFGGEDCDDGRRSVHPGNVEACNGIDDDCDGEVDEGLIGCRRP